MPTLRDIAAAARVSPATASRALGGHPAVAPATRARVRRAAQRLGWRPDPALRALARYRWPGGRRAAPATVVLLCDRWTATNRAKVAAARERAAALGWRLQVRTDWDPRLRAAGIIVDRIDPCRAALPWERCAVVAVGEGGVDGPCDRVGTDWRQAFALARARLPGARLGCAVFSFAGGALARAVHAEALLLAAEGGGPPPLRIDGERDAPALAAWLRRHRPDAVICADSTVPRLLRAAGVRAVRLDAAARLDPAPGVDLRLEARIVHALDLLHARVLAGETGRPAHPVTVLVPGRWTGASAAGTAR